MTYSAWVGPVIGTGGVIALIDQQWQVLMATTITGKEYVRRNQPDTGKWGEAKLLRNQIKDLLS